MLFCSLVIAFLSTLSWAARFLLNGNDRKILTGLGKQLRSVPEFKKKKLSAFGETNNQN